MGSNKRYGHHTDAHTAASYGHHTPVGLSEDEAGVTNRTLRRVERPIRVLVWTHWRDTAESDRIIRLEGFVEAHTPTACFVVVHHPMPPGTLTGSGYQPVEVRFWVWASAVVRLVPKQLNPAPK